jgi:hypothetical protein
MMGEEKNERELFSYAVNLEKRVRSDYPLRRVSAAIDFKFVREEVAQFYGAKGNVSSTTDQRLIGRPPLAHGPDEPFPSRFATAAGYAVPRPEPSAQHIANHNAASERLLHFLRAAMPWSNHFRSRRAVDRIASRAPIRILVIFSTTPGKAGDPEQLPKKIHVFRTGKAPAV